MKLRNKKTGEIVEAESCNSYSGTIGLFFEKGRETDRAYETLAELNEEWEDYTPKEPLIKDEKIRKAVRAWAEAVDADSAFVEKWVYDGDQFVLSDGMADIHFRITTPKEIKTHKRYTIAELCGEEQE